MDYKNDDMVQLRKVAIYGGVDKKIIGEAIDKLIYLDNKDQKPIDVIINSNGGDTHAAFAIIDIIRSLRSEVTTIGLGSILSAGLLIFMAGDKRRLTKNTSVLSHQYVWGSRDKYHELVSFRKEEELSNDRLVRYYKEVTGQSDKIIKEELLCPTDTWLTAEEALQYKIATEISK